MSVRQIILRVLFCVSLGTLLSPAVVQATFRGSPACADDKVNADLARAIRAGDLDAVKEAVAAGADLNALDEKKMPPIGLAALLGKVDILNFLADKGADLNRNDGFGYTPLMCAAQRGQSGAVRALLKRGADPTLKGGSGLDALTCALPKGPADPLYDGKLAAKKLLEDAIKQKQDAPPQNSTVADKGADNLAGEFDDLRFKPLDPKVWKSGMEGDNLVFAVDVPAPGYCTMTLFASADLPGDVAAFTKAFDDAVDAELKAKGVDKIEKDTGRSQNSTDKNDNMRSRFIQGTTKEGITEHFFVAIHYQDRLEMMAFQSSSKESYAQYTDEIKQFIRDIHLHVTRPVDHFGEAHFTLPRGWTTTILAGSLSASPPIVPKTEDWKLIITPGVKSTGDLKADFNSFVTSMNAGLKVIKQDEPQFDKTEQGFQWCAARASLEGPNGLTVLRLYRGTLVGDLFESVTLHVTTEDGHSTAKFITAANTFWPTLTYDLPAAEAAPAKPSIPVAGDTTKPVEAADLPGGNWNLSALQKGFVVLKTKYDVKANKVTWLLEKKEEGFVTYDVSFYDEDDVKLGVVAIVFEPTAGATAPGERTRGSVELPGEGIMQRVKRTNVTKR